MYVIFIYTLCKAKRLSIKFLKLFVKLQVYNSPFIFLIITTRWWLLYIAETCSCLYNRYKNLCIARSYCFHYAYLHKQNASTYLLLMQMWTGADLCLLEERKKHFNFRELFFAPIHAERWKLCRSAYHIRKAPELSVHKHKSSSASNRLHKSLFPIRRKEAVLEHMHLQITTSSPITIPLRRSRTGVLSFLLDLIKPDQWWTNRSNLSSFYFLLVVWICIWGQ